MYPSGCETGRTSPPATVRLAPACIWVTSATTAFRALEFRSIACPSRHLPTRKQQWQTPLLGHIPTGRTMRKRCSFLAAISLSSLEIAPVSYTHLRAHETPEHLVCR